MFKDFLYELFGLRLYGLGFERALGVLAMVAGG